MTKYDPSPIKSNKKEHVLCHFIQFKVFERGNFFRKSSPKYSIALALFTVPSLRIPDTV